MRATLNGEIVALRLAGGAICCRARRAGVGCEERVERRLAVILATDAAGYSRLMGEDEAGTLLRLRGLRRDPIDGGARIRCDQYDEESEAIRW